MENILLVEDDSSLAAGLQYTLKKEGYGVTPAATMRGALENIDSEVFSLAILDIGLPDGSGIIGFERESTKHPAGLRTHMLICIGSALAMLTGQFVFETIAPAG